MDKKELRYHLELGFDYINGCLEKGCSDEDKESLYKDYYKLEDTLYKDARNKMAITQLTRLETRARSTLKRLDKRFKK